MKAITSIGGVNIFSRESLVWWTAGLAIDADGSPRAYHPTSSKGLDQLSNAGKPGNWWALACTAAGIPFVQRRNDPAPGYYVSTTSLQDAKKQLSDPRRYVDSEAVPYLAIPRQLLAAATGANLWLGDLAVCVNLDTGKKAACIVADMGPANEIGEGSIALANALGVPSNPRTGGCEDGILAIVFGESRTATPWPRTVGNINAAVSKLIASNRINFSEFNA